MVDFIQKKHEVLEADKTMSLHRGQKLLPDFSLSESNIFLIGLRGCGKTTVGRSLAKALSVRFVDTDQLLVKKAGQSIADLVASKGWECFRDLEQQVLQDVCSMTNQVVATGGGIVLRKVNRELIKASGLVFYLMADIPLLISRLTRDPKQEQRPALSDLGLREEFQESLREREPLYFSILDYILPASLSVEQLVSRVIQELTLRT